MEKYNPQKIESKWRKYWEVRKLYQVDLENAKKPFYNLMMFPYPSSEGLHVGNVYAFTGSDIYGRFKMMQGYDVFEPMGFDAFGMHSENYAITKRIPPQELVPKNIHHFKEGQLKKIGAMFDWSCEVNTTDPKYYKWTQWIFIQLYKNGLAYKKKAPVNWCPSCKTVLADEQVINGRCERCETEVVKKETEQWFFRITKYAKRLLQNLDWVDWSRITKEAQREWIGKSEGALIKFKVQSSRRRHSGFGASATKLKVKNKENEKGKVEIEVFTTRPDTLFGATYMVLAPEHPLVKKITTKDKKKEVDKYIEDSKKKTEVERTSRRKEKTGIFTGSYAINPVNDRKIPIWVSDYVLMSYGAGAIMAVPAHDERDWEFAKKFELPIIGVVREPKIRRSSINKNVNLDIDISESQGKAYEGEGILVNSGKFNGMKSEEARGEIVKWLAEKGLAQKKVNFRLRDWCISRQRYWGPPIPIIYCEKCGIVPVPEKDLPVLLPETKDFLPAGDGKSPLARIESFVNTTCPKCGDKAKRETDVSDNFLDSAWYFLRYPSTRFDDRAFDKELTKKWLPVDMYIGGQEHACLHLMYTRFICMALHDLGYLGFEEPFKKFRAHGLIIKNGAKMSKSRGNVVNPDEYIKKYGADVFRMYLMFLGPYQGGGDFSDRGIVGIERFLKKVRELVSKFKIKSLELKVQNQKMERLMHKTIKKVTEDIEKLRYNTAISALMEFSNQIQNSESGIQSKYLKTLISLLAPFAPHISEELWQRLGGDPSVFEQRWQKYDEELIEEEKITLIVQINGKLRDKMEVDKDISQEDAQTQILQRDKVKKYISNKKILKTIFVPGRLINFVVEE